jgi:hypothetical protein
MSTIASTSPTTRNSLLRLSLIGGIISGFLHLLIQQGIVFGLILKTPIIIQVNQSCLTLFFLKRLENSHS